MIGDFFDDAKRRLLSKRLIVDECWRWAGAHDKDGYGKVSYNNEDWRVHRLALFVFKQKEFNPILLTLHKNICKYKDCFNPDHLYSGTAFQNTMDSVQNGTHRDVNKTHCLRGHEYTSENTGYTNGKRFCKTCLSLKPRRVEGRS